jgi:hypothetical protein
VIAKVFGVTSAKTNNRSVITTVATISPALPKWRTANEVAIVEPPIVNSSVRNSTTFRYGAGLSTIRFSCVEPRRFSSSRRTARTRFIRVIATSEAARNPVTTIDTDDDEDRDPIGGGHGARTPL